MLNKELLKILPIILGIFIASDDLWALDLFNSKPAATQKKAKPAKKKSQIYITADSIEQVSKNHILKARGHVVVRYEKKTIRADYIVVNSETGKGKAVGHVVMLDKNTEMRAASSYFNLKNQKGRLYDAHGKVLGLYRVDSKKLTRVGEDHYQSAFSRLTTCEGKVPDWQIQTDSMDLVMNDRAIFKNAIFKVRDIPVLYFPWGYVPINNERKSGFLMPSPGHSTVNGYTMKNAYYWAIDRSSDATFYLDYMANRGAMPGVEYRYTPSKTTSGQFNAAFLSDDLNRKSYYDLTWSHRQTLPENIKMSGKLDLGNNFGDSSIGDLVHPRANTDSFLAFNKAWSNQSVDVLTHLQESVDPTRSDRNGTLPQINYKIQRMNIGSTPFYFNQDASYTLFYTNLTPVGTTPDIATINRFDLHPQISTTVRPAPWFTVTPTLGARETWYSDGIDAFNIHNGSISREIVDFQTIFEGPKFSRVFFEESAFFSKIKHIVEPRVVFYFVPDIDHNDFKQTKIRVFDAADTTRSANSLTYYLTQRLFEKQTAKGTVEVLKFEVSQTYDIKEAIRADHNPAPLISPTPFTVQTPLLVPRPFSDLRFDMTSRFIDELMVNFNSTYSAYDGFFRTFNVQLGVKPIQPLSLYLERRYTRNMPTIDPATGALTNADAIFDSGTLKWSIAQGWDLLYSARLDEVTRSLRENDVSLSFNNKCYCWGFAFDYTQRYNTFYNGGAVLSTQPETKYMFNFILRGLGSLGSGPQQQYVHHPFN